MWLKPISNSNFFRQLKLPEMDVSFCTYSLAVKTAFNHSFTDCPQLAKIKKNLKLKWVNYVSNSLAESYYAKRPTQSRDSSSLFILE
jgi:hypothetical protein